MKLAIVLLVTFALLHVHAWPGHVLRPHRPIVSPTPTPTCVYDVPMGVGSLQRGYIACPDSEPDGDSDG